MEMETGITGIFLHFSTSAGRFSTAAPRIFWFIPKRFPVQNGEGP